MFNNVNSLYYNHGVNVVDINGEVTICVVDSDLIIPTMINYSDLVSIISSCTQEYVYVIIRDSNDCNYIFRIYNSVEFDSCILNDANLHILNISDAYVTCRSSDSPRILLATYEVINGEMILHKVTDGSVVNIDGLPTVFDFESNIINVYDNQCNIVATSNIIG